MRYLDGSDNHVLYRVTPYFKGNELIARGVEIEAYSVEDKGEGLCFHVFVYNIQPGIVLDYRTGESKKE
jgi:DNA-entry nuclease